MNPQAVAATLLGPIHWRTPVLGYCRCPGEGLHTHATKALDCRVMLDGVPTIYCFHASCAPAVVAANRVLRRELAATPWSLTLANGLVLRSGDLLQRDGTITGSSECQPSPAHAESRLLATLRVLAERFRPELLSCFHWPQSSLIADSPVPVAGREPEDQFRSWLRLWSPHAVVWIGQVFDSGNPRHKTHFRPVPEWYRLGAPVLGNFTCGSAFHPGSYQRSSATVAERRFMVVESDVLSRDEVGAIFAYLARRLRFTLNAVVDTAGKSLHGWFDAPECPRVANRLRAVLTALGCDPKLFNSSQPVRVPGAFRDGRLQRLIYFDEPPR